MREEITSLINRLTILPRWIIIIIDLVIIVLATSIGYLIRFNFEWPGIYGFNFYYGLAVCLMSELISTLTTRSYAGIVRYTGIEDGLRIFYTALLGLTLSAVVNLIYFYNEGRNMIPYSVLLIVFLASFVFLFYYRLFVKSVFGFYMSELNKTVNIVIFGAGQAGILTKQVIDSDHKSNLKVVAFLEDDDAKVGKKINGTRIFDAKANFEKIFKRLNVSELIISTENISLDRKNELVDISLRYGMKIRAIPPVRQWVRGELSVRQIAEINIEDLLGRKAIQIDNEYLLDEFGGKNVVITGAAGSIGSELGRQLIACTPREIILIDQAESALYELERELHKDYPKVKLLVYVADITNRLRLKYIFDQCSPDVIFHAAAYKHVPMMEGNPSEAIHCNILGTKILADLAVEKRIKKFVMISTDKAVNPTNVMGCSKRIAEVYVQSLSNHLENLGLSQTVFVTTRFGNVLGSSGSVIPIFKKQIEIGGPVTVTHPDIVRYFMTIPEACRLVLEAGVMGRGGEIFMFDMGKPIRIYDLAKRMILLSGLELDRDINIVFTGLREGEKLYEELLNDSENSIPTHHEKIMKAKVAEYPYSEINNYVELFEELIADKNELKMVTLMKEIIPEFKSNYSRFEVLDN